MMALLRALFWPVRAVRRLRRPYPPTMVLCHRCKNPTDLNVTAVRYTGEHHNVGEFVCPKCQEDERIRREWKCERCGGGGSYEKTCSARDYASNLRVICTTCERSIPGGYSEWCRELMVRP